MQHTSGNYVTISNRTELSPTSLVNSSAGYTYTPFTRYSRVGTVITSPVQKSAAKDSFMELAVDILGKDGIRKLMFDTLCEYEYFTKNVTSKRGKRRQRNRLNQIKATLKIYTPYQ
jgi:hypothetical protein